jgi:hypothetical protein
MELTTNLPSLSSPAKAASPRDTRRKILIAKNVEGRWQKVSQTGKVWSDTEARHPLNLGIPFGMTEEIHYQICQAAVFLFREKAANFVDLESGWRIALY